MSNFRLPSDYILQELSLERDGNTIDLKRVFFGLEIFEDIYSLGMTGNLHINDSKDLYDTLPIRGGEILTVEFATDEDGSTLDADYVFRKEFVVTGIKAIEQGSNITTKNYTIEFISKIYLVNHEIKLSRKYNDNVSNIVADIYNNVLKLDEPITVEHSKLVEEFIVPNWTPLKTIEYLSERAQSVVGEDTSYLFFETKDGFSFRSVRSLGKEPSTRKLSMENVWAQGQAVSNTRNIISELEVVKIPDIVDGISTGKFGGTLNVIDGVDKTYLTRSFEYDSDINSNDLINDNKLRSWPNRQANQKHYTIQGQYHGKNAQFTKLERISRINQLDSYVVLVKCPNWTKQKLGDTVVLNIKSAIELDSLTRKENINKTISGKYIIRGVRHIIALGGYDTVLELAKDSV